MGDKRSTEERLEEDLPHLRIDDIWRASKPIGRYQVLQFTVLYVAYLPAAFHIFEFYFIGFEPPHVCSGPTNDSHIIENNYTYNTTVEYDKCSIKYYNNSTDSPYMETSCSYGINYSVPTTKTTLFEWDLVCDTRSLGQLPHSMVLAGQGVGAALTFVADFVGRKRTQIWSQAGIWVAAFASTFASPFWLFSFLRLVTGTFQQGIVLSHTILSAELVPLEYRATFAIGRGFAWTLGSLSLAAVAYLLRGMDWRPFLRILSISSVGIILQILFLDESVRWLVAKGRMKEAVKIIKKAFKMNHVPFENIDRLLDEHDKVSIEKTLHFEENGSEKIENGKEESRIIFSAEITPEVEPDKKQGFSQFVRDPILLRNSLIVWFAWFVNVLVYYGLFLIPAMTIEDRIASFALKAASEFPKGFLMLWLCARFKRKTVAIILHAVAAVVLLAATGLSAVEGMEDELLVPITVLVMIGKLFSASSFAFLFIYTPEVFPTNMRQTGLGIASACGRIGGVLAPFSFTLAKIVSWVPGTIFGVGCLIVAIIFPLLPETNDKPLPQQTMEMKAWNNKSSSGEK